MQLPDTKALLSVCIGASPYLTACARIVLSVYDFLPPHELHGHGWSLTFADAM